MCTGWHAAVSADVRPGSTVVVVGDGAVGLSGVLAASQLGAERVIAMSRHADRQRIARDFGATDIIAERGDDGVERVKELTGGIGADAVLECVGTDDSVVQALRSARPGGMVGWVGVPHVTDLPQEHMFWKNVGLRGRTGTGPRLPARPARPRLERPHRAGPGLRPHPPAGRGRRGVRRHGRTPRHQDPPPPVTGRPNQGDDQWP